MKKMLARISWLVVVFASASSVIAQTNFATLATDGGWCWFSDPRAIFHNGTLYFGCVRSDGRSVLNEFNLQTGKMTNLWISSLTEFDDHDVCGLQVRQDNTLLALWSRHGGDTFFSYRQSTSTNPVSPLDWGPEHQANTVSGETYCNPYQLSAEGGKIYSFSRDLNYNPTVFTSTDNGATWSAPTWMIKTGTGGTRPYVKYCSDYTNRIDIFYTDAHPDNYTCSLYEMYYRGGAFYKTDGTFVTNFSALPILHDSGQRGSVVYQYNAAATVDPNDWIATARAWCWEIAYQTNGAPVCVFQTRVANVTGSTWADARIYYYYARWTGSSWQKRFIAQAGRPLYSTQGNYGGGMAVDPLNPNVVYISSDAANPFDLSTTTSVPLGAHYEIYKGITTNGGLNFTWSAITTNSTVDNCRPYVPRRFGGEPCVLWWRGIYNSYTSFYASIVGLFTSAVPTTTNTTTVPLPTPILPAPVKKANNSASLNQTNSWMGGRVPNAGNIAVWDNTVTAANFVALGANTGWAGILVTNPSGQVNISAGNTLTLGNFGIDMSGATANLNISSGLSLGPGNQIWNIAGGRTLALNTGAFSRPAGATLNAQGGGIISSTMSGMTNDASNNGGILGPWATIGASSATSYATISSGNIAGYSSGMAVAYNAIPTSATAATNYTLTSAGSVAYGAATRTMNTLIHATDATTLTWGNASGQINLIVNGILNSGSGLLTLAQGGSSSLSGVMVGVNNNRELVLNAANAPITISSRIIDSSAGASSVTVASSGTNVVTLNGINTYTGGTVANTGTLVLGTGGSAGAIRGSLNINSGAIVELNAADALGYGVGTCVTNININGGLLDNAVSANNGYLASWTLTGGTMSSSGVGTYHINAGSGNLITVNAGANVSAINANVAIRGANAILPVNVASDAYLSISGSLINSPIEAGANGMMKSGSGTLALSGANTYTGPTAINGGTLLVSGSISAGAVTVAGGGTLAGDGSIGGAVTVQSGGTIAPGVDANSIGALTINNSLTMLSGSQMIVKISRNGEGLVNDSVDGITSLTCGGNLIVTNLDRIELRAGDTFQIFSADTYGGSFANVILPSLGTNLFWTNNLAVDGSLTVVRQVSTAPVSLSAQIIGANLAMTWPSDHIGWRLQFQTNGLGTNWQDVAAAALTNWSITALNQNSTFSVFYRLAYP